MTSAGSEEDRDCGRRRDEVKPYSSNPMVTNNIRRYSYSGENDNSLQH